MPATGDAAPRAPRAIVPPAALLLAAFLCAACTAGAGTGAGGTGGGRAASSAPAPAPEPLDRIAAALGCSPEVTVDAQEVREGACAVEGLAFRVATFSTAQGRAAWLAESRQYGGTYLVGERWIITGPSADALTPARTALGGTLDSAPGHTHGAHPAALPTHSGARLAADA
ncbi:hypothetical protein [Streptomyces sp. NPDC059957]|uniref:hypothetical protein n=1 Tax=unclassified Streptomyces TaxID=2593676 RepID=UPI00364D4BF0